MFSKKELNSTPRNSEAKTRRFPWTIEKSWFLWLNTGFIILSTVDVFSNAPVHLLPQMDAFIHSWVVEHIPIEIQEAFFDRFLSNLWIVLPLASWIIVDILSPGEEPLLRVLFSPTQIKLGSSIVGMEAFEELIKWIFHRSRPKIDLDSYSFPSGHTAAAVAILGLFLFYKLSPFLVKDTMSASEQRSLENKLLFIWIVGASMTAVGRIGADAHWLSDTLVGGSLGALIVSIICFQRRKALEPF